MTLFVLGVSPPSDAGNSGDDGLSNLSIPELKALALVCRC